MLHGIRTFSHQSTVLRERVCGIAIINKSKKELPFSYRTRGKDLVCSPFLFCSDFYSLIKADLPFFQKRMALINKNILLEIEKKVLRPDELTPN